MHEKTGLFQVSIFHKLGFVSCYRLKAVICSYVYDATL